MAKSGYSEEEIKKLKRAKADPVIAPSKGQVLWEVSVEGPSSAPFIGRKYQHDEVFCYLSTPWGEYEKVMTGFTGRVVEVCARQGRRDSVHPAKRYLRVAVVIRNGARNLFSSHR
jgi:pyruvate carboxylase subunit B